MKMKFVSVICMTLALATLSACSPESKIKTSVKNFVGTEVNKEFDKTFGAKESKIMNELRDAFNEKMKIEVTDLNIEGDTATGKVNVTTFSKDFGALAMLVGMGAKEHDAKGRNIASIVEEARAKDPKFPALMDLPTTTITRDFKVEKQNGTWVVTEPKKM